MKLWHVLGILIAIAVVFLVFNAQKVAQDKRQAVAPINMEEDPDSTTKYTKKNVAILCSRFQIDERRNRCIMNNEAKINQDMSPVDIERLQRLSPKPATPGDNPAVTQAATTEELKQEAPALDAPPDDEDPTKKEEE